MVQDNESKYAVMTFDISGESQDEKEVQARAAQDSVLPNTVIFELFYKECPKTCDNFLALCQGDGETKKHSDSQLNYLNTPIHRIVKDAWIQGGDVVSGSGSNGRSIYGAPFADESFTKQHDQAGRLAMANNGPHSNTSQFYVTLRPLPFLDSNKVVFGQVVSGMSVVRRINATPTRNQRPVSPVVVSACGEYEQKISSENAAVASFTRATGKKKNSQVNQSPRKSAGEVERQQATLVVLGLDNAGKSTIGAVYNGEPDKMVMPTWGFEFEKFSYDNHQITLYGLGGGAKIRAIWPNYYDDVHGIVFVVDASDADRMNEAKQTLHAAVNDHRVMGKPVLILANKQDLKGALSATEIAMRLEVDKLEALSPVLILKSIAKCSEFKSRVHDVDPSLYEGMDWMLEEVSDQYSELNERIARDKKIRIEQERKKKAIAAEIRAKEKAEEAASDLLAQFDY